MFAHFYELLSLHEIYCLSFQALIKLPSTIAIATHNHRMNSDFSQFQSQFLYTHTQKINCLPLLFLNNIFLTQNGFLFLFIYYSMWQYKHHMTWYDFYLYFYFNHVSIFYPLLNDNHYFYIIPKFYGLN